MTFSTQSLSGMVDAALETYKIGLADHPVSVNLPSQLPPVDADPIWIQKLLGNMLENAAKYSSSGQPIIVSSGAAGIDDRL